MALGIGLAGANQASAGVAFGNCPVNGYFCFWQSYPRTSNNISSNVAINNHASYNYPFSGVTLNNHNKDNANLAGGSEEICNGIGYTGGGFVLSPGTGLVATTPAASSSRNYINGCNN